MSRANDKRKQSQGFGAGRPDEEDLARHKQTRSAIIVLAAFAVVAVVVLALNSNLFYRNVTAANVNGHSFSITDMNFFAAGVQDFDGAVEAAQQSVLLHSRALEEGLSLDEDAINTTDELVDLFANDFAQFGFQSSGGMVVGHYGRGMNLRILRERLEFDALGNMYTDLFLERLHDSYTEEMLETFYMENRDDYDRIRFRVHQIDFLLDDVDYVTDEDALEDVPFLTREQAREIADTIEEAVEAADAAEESGEDAFLSAVADVDEDIDADTATHRAMLRGGAEQLEYGDWLRNDAREAGDVTVVEGELAVYVVFFLGLEDNRYYTADVRHILIAPSEDVFSDEDGEPLELSDEERSALEEERTADALEKAEELLSRWQAGAATEDSFIELVQAYSEDYNEEADPGFIGEINRESGFVVEFRDWAMAADRQVGDVEIVETQFGFHIMYFVGHSDMIHRHAMAQRDKSEQAYQAWLEEHAQSISFSETFFARLVG